MRACGVQTYAPLNSIWISSKITFVVVYRRARAEPISRFTCVYYDSISPLKLYSFKHCVSFVHSPGYGKFACSIQVYLFDASQGTCNGTLTYE